jgi:hypothetical protein
MNKQFVIGSSIVLSLVMGGCGAADPLTSEEMAQQYEDVGSVSNAVLGTFVALPALPLVTTVQGFALTASADDASARLGFMFTDVSYRQALLTSGAIQNLGGVYDGDNAYASYKIVSGAWTPYEGRTTPQTYSFSELVVAGNASYYSTNYPSFGGLISVIRNGGKGAYALTPASTTRKAHSIAVPVGSGDLYSLTAQSGATGLTFSKFPISQFGVTFPNSWTNLATLAASASTVASPQVLMAGSKLAASYILGADAVIRATDSPATVSSAANLPVIGGCTGASLADIAWNGSELYAACVSPSGSLLVKHASLASLSSVTWTTVATSITGVVTALDLEASSTGVSLAVRIGTSVKVYKNVTDAAATFDELRPGAFDLARTASGIMIAICDLAGDRTLRTWVSP